MRKHYKIRIAIPTNSPGGFEAERSDHFGHCDIFTLLDVDDSKEIKNVTTIQNSDHEASGVMHADQICKGSGNCHH